MHGIERRLVEIWSEVLGQGTVGVHDNFFALGGDSILSIQVVSRMRAAGLRVEAGEFGADMQVELLNDGPVTLILERSA